MKRATVLIVEDDLIMIHALSNVLNIYEYDIIAAHNGIEALEVLSTHQTDLIISDINMPKMNGIVFFTEVKENPLYSKIPFIFISAIAAEIEHFLKYTPNIAYFHKPFSYNELVEKMQNMLKSGRQTVN